MEKVRALYEDFSARIQLEAWRKLLSDEVCLALDKRPSAEEALLKFLMEDYFLPQTVWQVLDDIFSLTARREELYENYPRDFVDHAVLNGIRFPASLPYDLFIPGKSGKDCDRYRQLYFKANQTAPGELASILEQMAALSEWHPYGQYLIHRLELDQGEVETTTEGCRKLAETYPQDPMLSMVWASLCTKNRNWIACERMTRQVLLLHPEHWQAKRLLAECLAKQGRYEDAKERIYELMRAAAGDQMQVHQLSEALQGWNEILIQQGEEQLRLHPEDSDNALKLAWSYLQNDKMDDTLRAGEAACSNMEDQYSYHNLHSKLRYSRKEFDLAPEHLQKLEAILQDMKPDGTEETAKRLLRLPEVMQLEGSCIMQLGQTSKAREKYQQALELAPEEPEILTHTVQLLYREGDYDGALPLLDRLIRLMPGAYHAYLLQALTLYELGRDQDAFDAVNRALELEGGDLNLYTLKMRILLRNGVWPEVHSILDFLEENEVGDEISVAWCKAQLTEWEERNEAKALELYLQLEALPRHPLSVEHNLADIYYQDLAQNAAKALGYYQFVLDRNEHPDLHFFAGTCKRYLGDYPGAEQHFLREQEPAPEDMDGYNGLAYVYEAMVRYGYQAGYRLRFDICCQFGLWNQAKTMLKSWKHKLGNSSNTIIADRRTGGRDPDSHCHLASASGVHQRSPHALMNLAESLWWSGSYEEEDARAELAIVRQLPLCESCDYCTCMEFERVLSRQDRTEIERARKKLTKLLDEVEFGASK